MLLLKYIIIFNPLTYFNMKPKIDMQEVLLAGILYGKSQFVRISFQNFLLFLISSFEAKVSLDKFFHHLLDINILMKTGETNELCEVAIYALDYSVNLFTTINLEDNFRQLLKFLIGYSSLTETPETCDKNFLLLLKIAERLAAHKDLLAVGDRIEVIMEIFDNWLFPKSLAEGAGYKSKSRETREAAYKLLSTLANTNADCTKHVIEKCLRPLCSSMLELDVWSYMPINKAESKIGYGGIHNLGNICYLVAMLQQFFHVAPFRKAIMSLKASEPNNEDVLYQLQSLFSYMTYSLRRDSNPRKFCNAYKEQDGRPLNISIQHDAHEFFNIFIDKIESALKTTSYNNLLRDIFGGKVCSQVMCKYCGFASLTYEDLYSLSLEIKNQKKLSEALSRFIEGVTVSDYYCEKCNQKRDVFKRTLLSSYPNVLIIHLQRFTFNLDTLMNEKIHTKLEFPCELDLQPYTINAIETNKENEADLKELHSKKTTSEPKVITQQMINTKYKLVGIVVHNGNAGAGHYYSFINVQDKEQWVEFNDSVVKEFDVNNIPKECFGGSWEDSEAGYEMTDFGDNSQKRCKSAYILFYEKLEKGYISEQAKELTEDFIISSSLSETNELIAQGKNIAIKDTGGIIYKLHEFNKVPLEVMSSIIEEVKKDNKQYIYEKLIYSQEFIEFACTLFSNSCLIVSQSKSFDELYFSLCTVGHKLFIELFPHALIASRSVSILEKAGDMLAKLISANASVGKDLLGEFNKLPYRMFSLLVACPEQVVRSYIGKLLLGSFISCIASETELFVKSLTEKEGNVVVSREFMLILISFINYDLSVNWSRFKEYFELLRNCVFSGGQPLLKFAFANDLIALLLNFFLEKCSPFFSARNKHYDMGNSSQMPNFDPLMELFAFLFEKAQNSMQDEPSQKLELSAAAKQCLLVEEILNKHLMCSGTAQPMKKFVNYMCYENYKTSVEVCQVLLNHVHRFDSPVLVTCLELIYELLSITDVYQEHRIELIFGIPLYFIKQVFFSDTICPSAVEQITHYYSVNCFVNQLWPLLGLLNYFKDKAKLATLKCLNMMFKLAQEQIKFYEYLKSLPAMNHICDRLTDWFKEYIESYDFGPSTTEANLVIETRELYDIYEHKLQVEKAPALQQYIIGNTIDTAEIKEKRLTIDNVELTLFEFYTEIYPPIPKKDRVIAASDMNYLKKHILSIQQTEEKKKMEETDGVPPIEEPSFGYKISAAVLRISLKNCI